MVIKIKVNKRVKKTFKKQDIRRIMRNNRWKEECVRGREIKEREIGRKAEITDIGFPSIK